jgi:hypothetical protein
MPRWALRSIYQQGSTLHQLYSIGSNDLLAVSFEEFERWLHRSREDGLIIFGGERKLLESLDLPVPDPMVLLTGPSLESPRVPSGIVPFEAGERFGIPALILVRLYPDTIDRAIRKRLSCGLSEPSRLGEGSAGEAIAETLCDIYTMLNGEVWFFLSVRKADGPSHEDFCRQAQALTEDADIATVVRFSLEGANGRYILLPPQCKTQQ